MSVKVKEHSSQSRSLDDLDFDVNAVYDDALSILLERNSNYGILHHRINRQASLRVPTAQIGFRNRQYWLVYNPIFMKEAGEAGPDICEHETLHMFHGHHTREQYLNLGNSWLRKKWNISCDAAINVYLRDEFKQIENIILPSQFDLPEGKSAEYYFKNIPDNEAREMMQNMPGLLDEILVSEVADEIKENLPDNQQPFPTDHEWDENEESGSDIKESKLRDAVEKEKEKSEGSTSYDPGSMPGSSSQYIDDITRDDSLPWYSYIQQFFRNSSSRELTVKKKFKDQRYNHRPRITTTRSLKLLAGVDTSGSVQEWYIRRVLSQFDHITDYCDLTIAQCDTEIRDVVEYAGNAPEIVGRGGTDFDPVFDHFEKHRNEFSGLIYFTDGFARFPDPKNYPVLWVHPPHHSECNWGQSIVIEQ